MSDSAEIIEVSELPFERGHNPNVTQEICNIVTINNTLDFKDSRTGRVPSITKESVDSVLSLYNGLSTKYGFEVTFDVESVTNNFKDIIGENEKRIFEIFVSKGFERFRLVFLQRAMLTISTLLDQVSSPQILNDSTLTIEYKYGMMTKLLELMGTVNTLYNEVKVENPDLELKAIADDSKEDLGLQDDPETIAIMKQLKNISLKNVDL